MSLSAVAEDPVGATAPDGVPDVRLLFHTLNNHLGIVLAHAELLEAKAPDSASRLRAEQVVRSVLDALVTAREIRRCSDASVRS